MGIFVSQNKYYRYPQINIKFSSFYGNIYVTKQILPLSTNKHKISALFRGIFVSQNKYHHYPQTNIKVQLFLGEYLCHKTNTIIIHKYT